jgi:uronate dehydrogenase
MLDQPASAIRFQRLLLTGAAGYLGRMMRPRLKTYCDTLRVSHRSDKIDPAGPGEELAIAELGDKAAVFAMVEGVDAIVHFGGVSTEQTWEAILDGNIVGMVNLYEAARHHGVRRIVFASSNHVTGFYRQDEVISPRDPVRPDGFYGLSKAFGENLAQLYWDRHGIETVSVRIGSSLPAPTTRRMLATWLSLDDTERLLVAGLTAPVVRHTVVYGMSDNANRWWDNTSARHLGYRPQDRSEAFRHQVESAQPVLDRNDPAVVHQGGKFVHDGPFFKVQGE